MLYSFKERKDATVRNLGQVEISISQANGTVLAYNDELADLSLTDTDFNGLSYFNGHLTIPRVSSDSGLQVSYITQCG